MMNTRFLEALKGTNKGRPPIWLMRQSGRYLPEYRALRSRHSFDEMIHRPELIVEATSIPLRRYPLDAAILFSDILLILELLDRPFHLVDSVGPVVAEPLNGPEELDALPQHDPRERFGFMREAIQQLRGALDVPLIGFCGGLFTVASYLIEGKSSRQFPKTLKWLYSDPKSFQRLLAHLAEATRRYLLLQIEAGVQAVQIFDTWVGEVASPELRSLCLGHYRELIASLRPHGVPILLFAKRPQGFIEELTAAGADGVAVDQSVDVAALRRSLGPEKILQGNLDPCLLYAPRDKIGAEVRSLLQRMQGDPRFIVNLGHGIMPNVDPGAVEALIDAVVRENG